MADEVDQEQLESETGGEFPPGGTEADSLSDTGINELGDAVAENDDEMVRANTRLVELEQVIASRDSEIASLNQQKDDLEERLATMSNSLTEAVAVYRDMVIQANPEIIGEIVSGETIVAINESLSQARALVSKIRQGLEAEISSARVPAGAPERTALDLSDLSPREKIQYAVGGNPSNR